MDIKIKRMGESTIRAYNGALPLLEISVIRGKHISSSIEIIGTNLVDMSVKQYRSNVALVKWLYNMGVEDVNELISFVNERILQVRNENIKEMIRDGKHNG